MYLRRINVENRSRRRFFFFARNRVVAQSTIHFNAPTVRDSTPSSRLCSPHTYLPHVHTHTHTPAHSSLLCSSFTHHSSHCAHSGALSTVQTRSSTTDRSFSSPPSSSSAPSISSSPIQPTTAMVLKYRNVNVVHGMVLPAETSESESESVTTCELFAYLCVAADVIMDGYASDAVCRVSRDTQGRECMDEAFLPFLLSFSFFLFFSFFCFFLTFFLSFFLLFSLSSFFFLFFSLFFLPLHPFPPSHFPTFPPSHHPSPFVVCVFCVILWAGKRSERD